MGAGGAAPAAAAERGERERDPNLCWRLARMAANITEICSAAQRSLCQLRLSVSPAILSTRFGFEASRLVG